ncbi:Alpha/Beta hydrolase protein [Collybia nuda]|uniref:Alpha/Beta hydrolase protein n=1 Tax=Collybia nuda TaxID=64659 RepID=A0A9P5Y2Q4_9AGAR|nr:Alpha/Beta hydrolase protein [Collybia nuda]
MTDNDRVPKQTLHPSVIDSLDPEYLAFYNEHLQYVVPSHTLPWDPSSRNPAPPGPLDTQSKPLEVRKTRDYEVVPERARLRVYTPEGLAPQGGWPLLFFIPGGGWVYGGLDEQASFSTNVCVRANCVVASLAHRLAPENPYPAAIEDAVEALKWVFKNGEAELGINTTRIAVGGYSGGGNVAATLVFKAAAADPPLPLAFQLLLLPITDNTASVETRWKATKNSPWLTPERMLWYRTMYLPNKRDWTAWEASPILAPKDLLKKAPPTWIAVGGADILRDEGIAYGQLLRNEGVSVEMQIYKGAPHAVFTMDGVMELGRELYLDAIGALSEAFGSA